MFKPEPVFLSEIGHQHNLTIFFTEWYLSVYIIEKGASPAFTVDKTMIHFLILKSNLTVVDWLLTQTDFVMDDLRKSKILAVYW